MLNFISECTNGGYFDATAVRFDLKGYHFMLCMKLSNKYLFEVETMNAHKKQMHVSDRQLLAAKSMCVVPIEGDSSQAKTAAENLV